jgi:ABC-type antimicrobial peptide transport system, ATPase component
MSRRVASIQRIKKNYINYFLSLRDTLGQTFIIVTHDENLASITDRTVHMKDGQIFDPLKESI